MALEFIGVSKAFSPASGVLNQIHFEIKKGEFFSLLGPSGCGKTTCLRLISGLERPSQGTIKILGHVVNDVHPHKRNVHMVFQKYALFPHLTVFDNIAFGLRMKRVPESMVKERVQRMLDLVRLGSYGPRSILKLSGGEQQRVALVRALVNEPAILLLDEPLGALDLKLREQMQAELASIQKQTQTTFVFVTHDQGEALTLSDRVAIMNKGRIEQIGTPTEIYENPATGFAARFVGASNIWPGKVIALQDQVATVEAEGLGVVHGVRSAPLKVGSPCEVMVRPEKVRVRVSGPDAQQTQKSVPLNVFRGPLTERVYFGPNTQIKLQFAQSALTALVPNQTAHRMPSLKSGERYYAVWEAHDSLVLPREEA